MRLILKHVSEKDGKGTVKIRCDHPEDMWHTFNMINVGDFLRTTTLRKVVTETATGSTSSTKKRMNLTIEIETVDFDTELCTLRVNGRNRAENPFVKMGQYHTLELEMNKPFSIEKDCWDTICLERIDMACDLEKQADVAALVLQEGLAHLCLLTSHMTLCKAKIEKSIPKKREGRSGHGKAIQGFLEQCLQAVIKYVDFSVVKCVLVASPGFTRDTFIEYMNEQAVRCDYRDLKANRSCFIAVHASSGHQHALSEVLALPQVKARLMDTKAQKEVQALADFFAMLTRDPSRAHYGFKQVLRACDDMAVSVLLVSDGLFRSQDLRMRTCYVKLVEQARENGAVVHIFSTMHESGKQLEQMTGVCAILRFPLNDLEDEEDEAEHEVAESGGAEAVPETSNDEGKSNDDFKPDERDVAAKLQGAIGWGGDSQQAASAGIGGGGQKRYGAEKIKRVQQTWKPTNIAARTKEEELRAQQEAERQRAMQMVDGGREEDEEELRTNALAEVDFLSEQRPVTVTETAKIKVKAKAKARVKAKE